MKIITKRINKRGSETAFVIILDFILLFFILFAYIQFAPDTKGLKPIGESQLSLFRTYEKAETLSFFLEDASRFVSIDAIKTLGEKGGKSKKDVIDYPGYPIWNNNGVEDYPTSVEYSISDYYNYTKYLSSFPYLRAEDVLVKITRKDSGFLVTSAMIKEVELIEDTDFNYDLDLGVKQEVDSTEKMCPIIDTVPITNYCNMASRSKCEIDKNIYPNLVKAQEAAKSMGYILYVNNAHRLYSDQVFLFKKYGSPRAAIPSCNAPHVLGKAVDVVLIDANSGSPLPGMSSTDGKGSDAEKMSDMTVGDRTKLEKIMCDAGFVRYVGEFWHYEIGTKRWEEHHGKDCSG